MGESVGLVMSEKPEIVNNWTPEVMCGSYSSAPAGQQSVKKKEYIKKKKKKR